MEASQKENYFKKVYENIENYGFHMTYILEEKGVTPFGYSTGIYKNFQIPEIFISGLPQGLTMELITNYVEQFQFKNVPLQQKMDNLIDRFPVYCIEVENEALKEYALTSFKYYQDADFKYLQLIFPDVEGRFPNEEGYEYDQEILGV